MKAFFFTLILKISSLLTAQARIIVSGALDPCVSIIEEQGLSAQDFTFRLIDRYDILVFCERKHNELAQYEPLSNFFIKSI